MNLGASTSEAIPLTLDEYALEFEALNPATHIHKLLQFHKILWLGSLSYYRALKLVIFLAHYLVNSL